MTSRRTFRGLIILMGLIIVSAWLAGCSLQRERSFKVLDDWSRGLRVGEASLRQPVGLAVDEEGAYLLWSARLAEGTRLAFAHVTPQGSVAVSRTVDLDIFFPRLPQLSVSEELEALVIARLSAAEKDGVYHLRLNRNGDLLGEVRRLSNPEQRSSRLSIAPAPDGSLSLLWDVTEGPGLGVYHLWLNADGAPQGFPQLIGPGGEQPAGQVDRGGTLHAAWLLPLDSIGNQLEYTTIAAGANVGQEPMTVASLRIPPTDVVQPLSLGTDRSHIYVMWSQEHRTGLQQGVAEFFVVSFPIDEPTLTGSFNVFVSEQSEPLYVGDSRFPPLTALTPPSETLDWSDFVEGPTLFGANQPDAALVLADASFSFRFESRPQLVLLVFQDGQFVGYQHPARTRQYSQRPTGLIGPDGHLHIAWIDLEQPGSYSVYYAATTPGVRAELDKRTANDTMLDVIDGLWGMASGLSLLPLLGVVLFPVLLVCAIFYFTGNDDSLKRSWSAQLTLAVAIIIYLGAKTLILAGVLARPPFLRSVPEFVRPAWVWIAALLVAVVAGLVLWGYIRRSDRPYLFRGALTFALVDALVTLILYGPTFYGE